MLQLPVTQGGLEGFISGLNPYLSKWERFIAVRRRIIPDDFRDAVDLMHLLLAYNLPGLPGYIPGSDVPGTDIHSLPKRESLLGKYFPFSVKQGLAIKFLARENIFFSLTAFSTLFEQPTFLFFCDQRSDEKKLTQLEEKIVSVFDWFRVVFKRVFHYHIIKLQSGNSDRQSAEAPDYPRFTEDVFAFLLMTDLIPLGIPYFICRQHGLSIEEMHLTWKKQLQQLGFERRFFYTDVFKKLPAGNSETLYNFLIEWVRQAGSSTLMESIIYSTMIRDEATDPGHLAHLVKEGVSNSQMFIHPSMFFYAAARQKGFSNVETSDRCYYLTLRDKKHALAAGIEQIIDQPELGYLARYLDEPVLYKLSEYRRLVTEEKILKEELRVILENIKEQNRPLGLMFASQMETSFNLDNRHMYTFAYPVRLSCVEYSKLLVSFYSGVEGEWELAIASDEDNDIEVLHRADSLEELFLFAIHNGIEWKKGVQFKNVGPEIGSQARKLWNTIEAWYSGDEHLFIGINWIEEKNKKRENYIVMSSAEDLLNLNDRESYIKTISLFIKTGEQRLVNAYSFSGLNSVSLFMQKLIEHGEAGGEFRLALCWDGLYRPLQAAVDGLLRTKKSYPFIMRESGLYTLITKENVKAFRTMYDLLGDCRKRRIRTFSVDKGIRQLTPWGHIASMIKEDRVQIFTFGRDTREVAVFAGGVFAGGLAFEKNELIREYLQSLFTFVNAIALRMKAEIELEIWASREKDDGGDYFQNIKQAIEYDSVSKRREFNQMAIHDAGSVTFSGGGISASGADLEEAAQHYAASRKSGLAQIFIDFCATFPGGMPIVDIIYYKLRAEEIFRQNAKNSERR